jgi:hypothetical protein
VIGAVALVFASMMRSTPRQSVARTDDDRVEVPAAVAE